MLLIDVHKFVGCTYCERKVLVEESWQVGSIGYIV